MRWQQSWKADPAARVIADRHYNRHKIGATQFVPPGRALVLRTPAADALWISSWPYAQFVRHAWAGAWVNSAFRREPENPDLASDLILEAVAATRAHWPDVPPLGLITFVDASKVKRKRDPGRCYRKAGFVHVGFTASGLYAFQLTPRSMPPPVPALGSQGVLA